MYLKSNLDARVEHYTRPPLATLRGVTVNQLRLEQC
jgi:hypothetical protein